MSAAAETEPVVKRVETLRRAAALMRQRADAATPGPWWVHRDDAEMVWYGDEALTYRLDAHATEYSDTDWDAWAETTGQLSHGDMREASDAIHIASWHPTVAIAVADMLDVFADLEDNPGIIAPTSVVNVALHYLGRAQ